MRTASYALACLLVASTARADRDPDFEAGLSSVPIEGNQVLPGPSYARPQLIVRDVTTAKTVGTIAAVGGGLSLAAGWVVFIARANFRLQPRLELGVDVIDSWETQGAWSMALAGFGASNLILAPYLISDSKSPSTLAWIGGVAGLVTAAVGVGFMIGAETCGPLALQPGSQFPVACMSATADSTFGPLLIGTALPLINWPLSSILRNAFSGPAESLTFSGTGVQWTQRF